MEWAKLHPGEEERMVAVVFLSKLADKVRKLKDPEIRKLSVEERIGGNLCTSTQLSSL